MPEASVYEHRYSGFGEHHVGCASQVRQRPYPHTEPQPPPMHSGAHP